MLINQLDVRSTIPGVLVSCLRDMFSSVLGLVPDGITVVVFVHELVYRTFESLNFGKNAPAQRNELGKGLESHEARRR